MEFIWILFAFICALGVKAVSLPPSVGYLIAGFILNFMGVIPANNLNILANLGITLMLFTIGLKLNIKDILKTEVWAGSLTHSTIWIVGCVILFKLITLISIQQFTDLSIETSFLIAFALSFSSTVCVVKIMEEQGEMRTRHGKLSIGILVMQDVVAVAFLVVATGKIPSVWALGLVGLFILKPLIYKVVNYVGHGELIPLAGFFLALGGYELFELVHIKGDLGALLIGMLLAAHPKASEINKSLLSYKDLFLIGFFLMIGFTALPTFEMVGIALLICLLLPVKFILFVTLLSAFKIRARNALLASLVLANFSEFGLIVAALSVETGWLSKEWLVILALSVAISFVITNIIYRYSESIFRYLKPTLKKLERKTKLPEDVFTQPSHAPIVVIGMGRVGIGAFNALRMQVGRQVWGMDADNNKVEWLNKQDLETYCGDAIDIDFWDRVNLAEIKLILLAMPSVQDIANITAQIKRTEYRGQIAAIARFDDEAEQLEALGIDKVFNFYNEAGVGFAEESLAMIK